MIECNGVKFVCDMVDGVGVYCGVDVWCGYGVDVWCMGWAYVVCFVLVLWCGVTLCVW